MKYFLRTHKKQEFVDQGPPQPASFSNAYYKTLATGYIPSESLEVSITTIHKPGKSPHDPANYCNISLFNTDLKMCAKLLATHLAQHMPHLVHLPI